MPATTLGRVTGNVLVVQPEDDEGPEEGGGPPPDPSQRTWRHPSELAALRQGATPPPPAVLPVSPIRSSLLTIGGAAAGVVVLVGLAVVFFGPMSPDGDLTTVDAQQATGSNGVDRGDGAGPSDRDPTTTTSTEATAPDAAEGGRSTTSTTVEAPTTSVSITVSVTGPDPVPEAAPLSRDGGLLDPAFAPPPAELFHGVFGLTEGRLHRLADYVAIDDFVVTSASAIGDHVNLALLLADDLWTEAEVVGTDPDNDLAVLRIVGDEVVPADSPWSVSTVTVAGPMVEIGVEISLATLDADTVGRDRGTVIGVDQPATSPHGTTIYGTVQTSIALPDSAIGGPVYGDGSMVIAVVIASSDYLASAIPIDRVVEISLAIVEHGAPAPRWIGVEAQTGPDGGAVVVSVEEGSPAEVAGLRAGDRIVVFDGVVVEGRSHLTYLLRETAPGTAVAVEIERDGGRHTLETVVVDGPGDT